MNHRDLDTGMSSRHQLINIAHTIIEQSLQLRSEEIRLVRNNQVVEIDIGGNRFVYVSYDGTIAADTKLPKVLVESPAQDGQVETALDVLYNVLVAYLKLFLNDELQRLIGSMLTEEKVLMWLVYALYCVNMSRFEVSPLDDVCFRTMSHLLQFTLEGLGEST